VISRASGEFSHLGEFFQNAFLLRGEMRRQAIADEVGEGNGVTCDE
jgi:hypothetical protein